MNNGELKHYGTPKRSGRYPWGSGADPYQRTGDFSSRYFKLKDKGLSDTEIAKEMGMSTTQLRAKKAIAGDERRTYEIARVKSLKSDGLNNSQIARQMGMPESTVRSLLNAEAEARTNQAMKTAQFLKEQVDSKGMIDIGNGVERELGISKQKLQTAISILEEDGYVTWGGGVPQVTNPGKQTNIKVLCKPGTEHKDIYNFEEVKTITEYQSTDGGDSFGVAKPPKSIDSSRVMIKYGDEGGTQKDGVIELRRGVEDISLGNSHYAQVRIAVDGTHYMKGMAIYSDDLPDGVDIVYNTNKKSGTPKEKVFKEMKKTLDGEIDMENPFGALIKKGGQRTYIDADGNEQLSVINKLREEGDWNDYSKKLASQMLGKQNLSLIKRQLDLTYADREVEFDEICSLTNPTVKKQLLESFADDCDGAAVHLKATALPRQTTKVLLPVTTLKDNEIYAPTYRDGETVCLVRFPHGGTFEIPELVVNNKHKDAKHILGNAIDAVGINLKVAERLSGADFDGDTALVIPTNSKVRIKTSPALKGLEDFDPKSAYPAREGMTVMTKSNTQQEMGKISNLITDMTLKGADFDEIAKAVRHSMVVIDAEKHKLDYKLSEVENDIASLKAKYQGRANAGASTLLSKAKSEERVDERKAYYYSPQTIDPKTGEKIYKDTGRTYLKDGKVKKYQTTSTKMAEAKDAFELSSGTPEEEAYATYANKMKSLANRARKEYLATGRIQYDKNAHETYKNEVASLNAQLNLALLNAPRERRAQLLANSYVKAKKQDNPDMTKEELKKAKSQALAKARVATGADKTMIKISEREWEAIQAGALSDTKVRDILNNTKMEDVKKLATPKATNTLSEAKQTKLKAMSNSGYYTIADIADALGVSTSVVSKYMKTA